MSLYNVEFFDRFLNCTHHAQTNIDYFESDYIAPESTTLTILKTYDVKPRDIVLVQELPDYVWVVDSVDQKEFTTSVRIKPFVTIFEQPLTFDTSRQKGEIEFRMGVNYLYFGSPSDPDRIELRIFLKPEEYKLGLFNAAGGSGVQFKNLDAINAENTQFVCKCGNSMFNQSAGRIYGPRVCANGAVNQPDVGAGYYLYYRIDNDGNTSYGYWDRSMIQGSTTQEGETVSGEEWLRKNVQLLCSPSYIFSISNGIFQSYSGPRYGGGVEVDKAFWSFFGKDRHGRFFLGKYHEGPSYNTNPTLTPKALWNILVEYCSITELAIVGGGYVESGDTFVQMPVTGMRGWEDDDMSSFFLDSNVGDTFAFYRTYGENEEVKKPCIRTNRTSISIRPDTSLENTLSIMIRMYWVTREGEQGWSNDELMNLPVYCDTTSTTNDWNLGIKPENQASDGTILPISVVNFYSTLILEAFKQYRVAVNAYMDWSEKKICLSIGQNLTPVHIDADLPNVKIKEFIDGKPTEDVNKLEVVDYEGYANTMYFYRYANYEVYDYRGNLVNYGPSDMDRIYPVVNQVVLISSKTNEGDNKKDFRALAWEQAESIFGSIKYKNYIELDMYNPPAIQLGQLCYIHHEGETYETILSGYKEGNMKTLIFGAYRADYTKTMIVNKAQEISLNKKASKTAKTANK